MWTRTHHQFTNEAAFLAACDAAGWPRDPQGRPLPPAGVALDVIGPMADPRFHVNAAWHAREPDAAFSASTITPATPERVWA